MPTSSNVANLVQPGRRAEKVGQTREFIAAVQPVQRHVLTRARYIEL